MSLALAHKQRMLEQGPAASSAGSYTPATALAGPANAQKHLALMTTALAEDLARLSDLNSMADRQQLKREELLPKYLEYVQRYRDSGLSHPNMVVMQVLVWLFDTEQFEAGLELALFAIEQGQEMPARFKRDVPTFVADAVIDWAEAEQKAKRSPEPYLSQLMPYVDGYWAEIMADDEAPLPTPWKLYERIPARFHKLLGILAMEQEQWGDAVDHFERATTLYPEIGVKTRMDDASKALRKQQAEQDKADENQNT
ncbi:phage terminase small subunit [Pseudomonas sp. 1928-m]|uniref:phage terminase small subunit n=1 Tax=Pseudomonas sp. 1928-m TaxID=3033804 RepID=UPI0023DF38E2|nr:phage terminase small subunit [Pseudomonas sp. 1928-m]MDF3195694.1 phage terminase small subunit [Pseudomonas sp. 1928-m]